MPRRQKADSASQAFGKNVRQVREEKGLSIEEVAGRITTRSRAKLPKPVPMDAKSLGEIERGWYSPTLGLAKKIADALEVPLTSLLRDL
jgi:transcriptional regulator with XRE-family HTH domain